MDNRKLPTDNEVFYAIGLPLQVARVPSQSRCLQLFFGNHLRSRKISSVEMEKSFYDQSGQVQIFSHESKAIDEAVSQQCTKNDIVYQPAVFELTLASAPNAQKDVFYVDKDSVTLKSAAIVLKTIGEEDSTLESTFTTYFDEKHNQKRNKNAGFILMR